MTIQVTLACGHQVTTDPQGQPPICPTCGDRRVSFVKAPPPKFKGAVQGPCVKE